jgi:hypothetical protein
VRIKVIGHVRYRSDPGLTRSFRGSLDREGLNCAGGARNPWTLTNARPKELEMARYITAHGVDAARLKTVGYGEGRLFEPGDAHAAVNRRVQCRGG